MSEENKYILQVKDLHTSFATDAGEVRAVNGVSFNLEPGKTLGIVGESGSGKSVFTKTFAGMLDSNGFIDNGKIIRSCRFLRKPEKLPEERYFIAARISPSGTKSRCRSSEGKSARSFSRIR